MTLLHAHFALRNQQAFRHLLQQHANTRHANVNAGSSNSGNAKSRPSALPAASDNQGDNVNTRDCLGRTVLHVCCATTDPPALEFVRILLAANVTLDVNLQDEESHWTALHCALYAGNIPAA